MDLTSMATFDEIIVGIEAELNLCQRTADRSTADIKAILGAARTEGRSNLTDAEDRDVTDAKARRDKALADVKGAKHRLELAKQAKADELENDEALNRSRPDPVTVGSRLPAYDRVARVGREERTYRRDMSGGGGGAFLADLAAVFLARASNPEAEIRLARHMTEERTERPGVLHRAAGDAGTSAFTGLVVPEYLTELYAPKVAARRPFADACNRHDLPEKGMTINISRITTSSSVTNQASEFAAASATSMDDTLLTENVLTYSGQQSLSRQALDRGLGIEDVMMDDLQRQAATNLDNHLITDATTGLAALGVAVAYTDASPTGPEAYPKLLGAAAGVEAALLGFANPDIAVMHSRRWYWFNSQMTTSWPMFGQPSIAPQLAGVNLAERYGSGVRGVLPNGMVAIIDNNCATNIGAGTEDEIYVASSDECHLWEDPANPQFIRAEQPQAANLAVTFVLYGYYAYCFRRFTSAVGRVSGTGLIAPVF